MRWQPTLRATCSWAVLETAPQAFTGWCESVSRSISCNVSLTRLIPRRCQPSTDEPNKTMKMMNWNKTRNPLSLLLFVAVLLSVLAGQLAAQTFATLYSFSATDLSTGTINNDGAGPVELFLSKNILY